MASNRFYIGIDEAGRGPVIGPMVIAGVLIESNMINDLVGLEVKDSKQLSPKKREELVAGIKFVAKCKTRQISAEEIDKYRDCESLNTLELKVFANVASELISECLASKKGDEVFFEVIADCPDVNELRFSSDLKKEVIFNLTRQFHLSDYPDISSKIFVSAKHKADETNPVVSSASIIAKVERDAAIRKIESEFRAHGSLDGNEIKIGSGYPSDNVTIRFLTSWYKAKGSFPPHTRSSWETCENIIAELKKKNVRNKKLTEFNDIEKA